MTPFQIISLIPGVVFYVVLSYLAYLSWKKKEDELWIGIWLMITLPLAIILPLIAFVK